MEKERTVRKARRKMMSSAKEIWEEMHELALIMDGWFEGMYVDTSLRFRPIPKTKKEEEDE